jgi:hypothetical protein
MLFQYVEKWTRQERFEWRCVGFSNKGDYIALGGANCLIIASAEFGKDLAAVKHQASNVVSLQWSTPNTVLCAYEDGTIVDVKLDKVRNILLDKDDLTYNLRRNCR